MVTDARRAGACARDVHDHFLRHAKELGTRHGHAGGGGGGDSPPGLQNGRAEFSTEMRAHKTSIETQNGGFAD